MTDRSDGAPSPTASQAHEPYSPQRRTALVLTGTGTAGAYHAGVLRALHEAGVKLDIVAGRGVGVIGALFAAVDGAQRLWDEKGFWRADGIERLYEWRLVPRVIVWALAVSLAIVAVPIAAVALGLDRLPDRLPAEDGRRRAAPRAWSPRICGSRRRRSRRRRCRRGCRGWCCWCSAPPASSRFADGWIAGRASGAPVARRVRGGARSARRCRPVARSITAGG